LHKINSNVASTVSINAFKSVLVLKSGRFVCCEHVLSPLQTERHSHFLNRLASTCRDVGHIERISTYRSTMRQEYFDPCIAIFPCIDGRQRLRSATQQLMVVPRHRLTTVGRRAFAVHGPVVWNSLPDYLPAQQDYESFRQGLKTWGQIYKISYDLL